VVSFNKAELPHEALTYTPNYTYSCLFPPQQRRRADVWGESHAPGHQYYPNARVAEIRQPKILQEFAYLPD
jgi:hypothetical protein